MMGENIMTNMTWDEIYEAAVDTGFGDDRLKAKDEARYQVKSLAMELGGSDLDKDECPEDIVDDYCKAMKIRFDERGNIVDLTLPDWIEDIIYRRKSDTYLKEDLQRTVANLKDDVEISDDQMQKMVEIYRHNEDSNAAMNDTLADTVYCVLGL